MTEAMFKLVVADPVNTPPGRVYLDYYQLCEAPFAITPDPDFLFSSSCHQQVLDKIGYAIDGRMGFVLLTGEVGTGKTTLCRTLLDRLSGKAETVYIINPSVSGHELLVSILEDLGINPEPNASKKNLIDVLNQRLLSNDTSRPFVVIIDDAQTMTPETLEDLRLLSNLETDKHKLLQVVLSGQPELLDMLANRQLRQLKQRIAVHCRLKPLSTPETVEYISRRLFVAGNKGQVHFSHPAAQLIHKTSGGIPRLINKICDFALTAGYVKDSQAIGISHVKRALTELDNLDFSAHPKGNRGLQYGFLTAAMLVLIAAVFFTLQPVSPLPGEPVNNIPMGIEKDVGSDQAPAPLQPASVVPEPTPVISPLLSAAPDKPVGEVDESVFAEAPDKTEPSKVDQEKPVPSPSVSPAPYALQLGSFRTLQRARQGSSQHLKKGVAALWQVVGNGQWIRIVAGKFENFKQAEQYKRDHGLKKALIIYAPLTVKVLPRQPDTPDAGIRSHLSEIGYDSLVETGTAGDKEIYTGLFMSIEDAVITAERINSSGRFLARVVTRQTAPQSVERKPELNS